MRVYVSVPLPLARFTWLESMGVSADLHQELEHIGGTLEMVRTRWYIDMPEHIATLYKLKWS